MSDGLIDFATHLFDEVAGDRNDITPEVRQEMIADWAGRLEDQINAAMLQSLTDEQFKTLQDLPEEQYGAFFAGAIPNQQELVVQVMTDFAAQYR